MPKLDDHSAIRSMPFRMVERTHDRFAGKVLLAWALVLSVGAVTEAYPQNARFEHSGFALATAPRIPLTVSQDLRGQDSPARSEGDAGTDVNPSPVGGIPIEPDANEKAWLREVITIGLMFVMGIFCTILAFLAVWMLQRSVTPANAGTQETSSSSSLGDGPD